MLPVVPAIGLIAAASERFADACAGADPAAVVPACPGWTVDDLRWHLTEVQDFWGTVVLEGHTSSETVVPMDRPDPAAADQALRDRSRRLVDGLADAEPGAPCWSWDEVGGGTVAWVVRRQAHEAIVHRVDAEQAASWDVHPIAPEAAADGVDEALGIYLTGVPAWARFHPGGGTIELVDTDTRRRWGLEVGRMTGTSLSSGRSYDLVAAELRPDLRDPAAVVAGPGCDLYLWLWGRVGPERLEVDGDRALVGALRALAADATG